MNVNLSDKDHVNISLEISEARELLRRIETVIYIAGDVAHEDESTHIEYLDDFYYEVTKVIGKE